MRGAIYGYPSREASSRMAYWQPLVLRGYPPNSPLGGIYIKMPYLIRCVALVALALIKDCYLTV